MTALAWSVAAMSKKNVGLTSMLVMGCVPVALGLFTVRVTVHVRKRKKVLTICEPVVKWRLTVDSGCEANAELMRVHHP